MIATEILIAAPPERVWSVLTDFAVYPEWNPFIITAEGEPLVGQRLRATFRPPGGSAQTFKPVVLRAEAPQALVWRGSLPIPGLITGEHSFFLTQHGDQTRFQNSETFSGLFVPFLGKLLRQSEEGFQQMNAALKARAERRSA
ncbi:MAG: SRPBCC domain-containing protein [Rhodomicrobiaceae bacterium]